MLDLLRKTLPKTKVVAVGLLPRGEEVGPKSFNRVVRPSASLRTAPNASGLTGVCALRSQKGYSITLHALPQHRME